MLYLYPWRQQLILHRVLMYQELLYFCFVISGLHLQHNNIELLNKRTKQPPKNCLRCASAKPLVYLIHLLILRHHQSLISLEQLA